MGKSAHPQPPPQPPHHGPQNHHQCSVAALAFSEARFASMNSATLDMAAPGVTAVIRGVPAPFARSATSSLVTPPLVLRASSLDASTLTWKVTACGLQNSIPHCTDPGEISKGEGQEHCQHSTIAQSCCCQYGMRGLS